MAPLSLSEIVQRMSHLQIVLQSSLTSAFDRAWTNINAYTAKQQFRVYGIVGQSQFDRSSRAERRSIMNVNVDLCLTTQYSCLESTLDGPIHWPIGSRKERKNY